MARLHLSLSPRMVRLPMFRRALRLALALPVLLACLLLSSPPAEAAEAVGTGPLAPVLDPIIDSSRIKSATLGLSVLDLDSGAILYARGAADPLNPASCLKVVTAAAALEALGPGYRFQTDFLRVGDAQEGVLMGDLYIRGTGDPEMVYERLWKAAVDLRSRGVERVKGNLILDDSFFDEVRDIAGWELEEGESSTSAFNAPVSALSANFNAIGVVVAPGVNPGDLAHAALETPTGFARIRNQAITGRTGSPRTIDVVRRPVEGGVELVVKGTMPLGAAPKIFYRPVVEPAEYYGALFKELFHQAGGRIEGNYRRGKTPDAAKVIFSAVSPPLSMLVADMDKFSNNFIAEHLLKAVGASLYGAPGTTEKGLRMSRSVLEAAGIPWSDVRVTNGSGLSRANRLSAQQFCVFLRWASKRFLSGPEFLSSLTIAGMDGTLRSRLGEPGLKGMVRGKTGTVNGVATLVGVQETRSGQRLAFAFLANGLKVPVTDAREVFDHLCQALAGPVAGGGTPTPAR